MRALRLGAPRARGFRALISRSSKEVAKGEPTTTLIEAASLSDLPCQDPDADVEVAVTHSDLNYKDGMILSGQRGLTKSFPIVPGIDYAGHVVKSSSALWREGDSVILTGNKAGQYFDGGYSERAACRAEWLVALPSAFSLATSMVIGTAGVTAAMCVDHLERFGEIKPSHGPVLVTGAAGGLGQVAIALLAARGFEVIASTGRSELEGPLKALGATTVIGRLEPQSKPLGSQRWAGVVDAVGGSTLAAALAQTSYRGAIASTGVAGGGGLETTVYPLILRGVRLLGVDSTMPYDVEGFPADPQRWAEWQAERRRLWMFLADTLTPEAIDMVHAETIGLGQLTEYAPKVLAGKVAGRVVVDMAA